MKNEKAFKLLSEFCGFEIKPYKRFKIINSNGSYLVTIYYFNDDLEICFNSALSIDISVISGINIVNILRGDFKLIEIKEKENE